VVDNRRVVGAYVGAVGTCSGQTVVRPIVAVLALVVSGAEAEAVDTLAFEAGVAAVVPRMDYYQRSLATYAGELTDLQSCLIAALGRAHRHTADVQSTALSLAQGA